VEDAILVELQKTSYATAKLCVPGLDGKIKNFYTTTFIEDLVNARNAIANEKGAVDALQADGAEAERSPRKRRRKKLFADVIVSFTAPAVGGSSLEVRALSNGLKSFPLWIELTVANVEHLQHAAATQLAASAASPAEARTKTQLERKGLQFCQSYGTSGAYRVLWKDGSGRIRQKMFNGSCDATKAAAIAFIDNDYGGEP
jgi:hypothetical protein